MGGGGGGREKKQTIIEKYVWEIRLSDPSKYSELLF